MKIFLPLLMLILIGGGSVNTIKVLNLEMRNVTKADIVTVENTKIDWMNIFANALGAFLGALLILGIDRIVNRIIKERSFKKNRKDALLALEEELHSNLQLCDFIIASLGAPGVHHSIFSFAKFEYSWIKSVEEKYISYYKESYIKQRSILFGLRSLIKQIHKHEDTQMLLHACARTNSNFPNLAYQTNQSILKLTKELRAIIIRANDQFCK